MPEAQRAAAQEQCPVHGTGHPACGCPVPTRPDPPVPTAPGHPPLIDEQTTAPSVDVEVAREQRSEAARDATAWLQQCIPECCDELGVPHCRFLGAALMLHYGLGEGNVRRDLVKDRVRRLSPSAYDDIYGAGAAAA